MSDELALRAAILAYPDEDTPRLMFADWLDENDRPDQAEFIRLQIERSHTDRDDPRWRDLIGREAELLVAAKHTWLRPYLPWTDISQLTVRRGLVELAGAPATHLAPHVGAFRELTTLLELHVSGYYHNSIPTEEEPPNDTPPPAPRRGWVSGMLKRAAALVQPAPDPPHPGYLCRIALAARPPGMRVRALLSGYNPASQAKSLFLELLDPNATELTPPLETGVWTVLAWNPDVPEEWRFVGTLARALCLHTQNAPFDFYRLQVAACPVHSAAELTAWSGLGGGNVGPFWLRFHDGEPTELLRGFVPPADWLGGVSL